MADNIDSLSDDDIRRIALLVETLDRSTFDYLTLDVGGMKLTIGKGEPPATAAAPAAPAAPKLAAPAEAPVPATIAAAPAEAPVPATATAAGSSVDDGSVAIAAPVIGRFYATPQPGAAPYVSVGDTVTPETTVGLIEVMKVFTAIPAGVSGVVTEVYVKTEQFVEYGQMLFRVRPVTAAEPAALPARPKRARAR